MADVEIRGVTKSCGDVIVIPEIDLHIPHESFTVFVGPSGCGKPTVLRMIAGLETPSERPIGGLDVTHKEPKELEIAMVFQSYALYPQNDGGGKHRFRADARKAPEGVDQQARTQSSWEPAAFQSSRKKTEGTLKRPAAAGGNRPRYCAQPEGLSLR